MNQFTNTKLNLTVKTDYTHDTPLQEAENKIEKAAIHLSGIFNLLKLTAEVNFQNEKFANEGNAIIAVCEIGESLVNSIREAVMVFPTESNASENVAAQLSDLMNNPTLPTEVFNAFQSAFDNLRNELPSEKRETLEAHELTPKYLETFLSFYPQSNE